MAHRLFRTSGKCEQIHGHSWQVTLGLYGEVDGNGLLDGIDFGSLKTAFRRRLDSTYDHKLLLNRVDPFASEIHIRDTEGWVILPGLRVFDGDPTTENLAAALGQWALAELIQGTLYGVDIEVWETAVNNSEWKWRAGD